MQAFCPKTPAPMPQRAQSSNSSAPPPPSKTTVAESLLDAMDGTDFLSVLDAADAGLEEAREGDALVLPVGPAVGVQGEGEGVGPRDVYHLRRVQHHLVGAAVAAHLY